MAWSLVNFGLPRPAGFIYQRNCGKSRRGALGGSIGP